MNESLVILIFYDILDADLFSGLQLVVLLPWASCTVSGARSLDVCLPDIDCLARCESLVTLVGIPANLSRHLQSVLNAAARSVAGLRCSDHITNTLASFYWLRVSERIQFKLATLIYKSLYCLAPQCLVDDLRYVVGIPGRR